MKKYNELLGTPLCEALKLAKMKEGGDTLAIGLDSDGALHVRVNDEYIVIDQPENLKEIKKVLKGL